MASKRIEWRVGLFVFIGMVLLAALLVEFSKGTAFFRPTYKLYLTAKNVGGLRPHASILMAGVQVGSVGDIRLNENGKAVTITLEIYRPYEIHQDARFLIEQAGFLGDQYVAIIPTENKAPPFPPGGHAEALPPFNLQEAARSAAGFVQRIDETAKKLDAAVSDVRRLVLNEQTLTNLSATVGTMRVASEHALATVNNINTLVNTNASAVGEAVSNVVFFSRQMTEFGDQFGTVLSTNSTEITAAVKNIESSTEVLKDLLDQVQAGQGLAGTILKDPVLASNVESIAGNLAVTTSNLNRLGLWGILWAHKPPRTNAPPVRPLTAPRNPFK